MGPVSRGRRRVIGGVILLGLLSAAGAYWKYRHPHVETPRFTVAKVERGDLTQSVATTGILSPRVTVEVSSQISGLITAVVVDFNSPVRKGQVLARIDPAIYEQELQRTQANLAAAQATHALNALNVARLKGLREAKLVTQPDYDQAAAILAQSQANVLTQRAAVKNARTDLERCTITSPIDGIVIYRQAEVGKTIVSSFSAPVLFTIAQDLSQMRILAPINEVDVASVLVGANVTFTVDALPGRTFHGRLTQIRNPYTPSDRVQQNPQQGNGITSFDGIIEVDNADFALRPSLTASVSIIVSQRAKVLKIPSGALTVKAPEGAAPATAGPVVAAKTGTTKNIGSPATVYRLPNGTRDATPQAVAIQTGSTDGIDTEIVSGLREGDTIITGTASTWDAPKQSLFN